MGTFHSITGLHENVNIFVRNAQSESDRVKNDRYFGIQNEYLFQTQFLFLPPTRLQKYHEYVKKADPGCDDCEEISTPKIQTKVEDISGECQ